MTTQSTDTFVSQGVCAFCKTEITKGQMTRYLKSCKARLATIATQEKKSRKTPTRLLHILAEGKYNPEYWLHFEMPAKGSLDSFLKDMWIDDVEHLSGFTIDGTTYSDNEDSGDYYFFGEEGETGEVEEKESEEAEEKELTEEERAQELSKLIEETLTMYSPPSFVRDLPNGETATVIVTSPQWDVWITEVKKPRSLDDLIDFLKEEYVRIEKARKALWKAYRDLEVNEMRQQSRLLDFQRAVVSDLLENVEDRSMDVLLQRVLKVGQKFSYIYDYGSSTYINLRVISEREGIVQNKKEPVQLLAQNSALRFPCSICGKPATMILVDDYVDDMEENVFCDTCAKKELDEGDAMPIINSPRVGVL